MRVGHRIGVVLGKRDKRVTAMLPSMNSMCKFEIICNKAIGYRDKFQSSQTKLKLFETV